MSDQLPAGFKDLEPYVGAWALPRFSLRQTKRLQSSMREIREFYEAMMPRLNEVVDHLNKFDLDEMPAPEQRLLELCLSLANVGNCVTLWHAPDQANAFEASRMEALLDD